MYFSKQSKFSFLDTTVFRYLADKYLQRLKQQTAEDPEVVHTSSNKIGKYAALNSARWCSLLINVYSEPVVSVDSDCMVLSICRF